MYALAIFIFHLRNAVRCCGENGIYVKEREREKKVPSNDGSGDDGVYKWAFATKNLYTTVVKWRV